MSLKIYETMSLVRVTQVAAVAAGVLKEMRGEDCACWNMDSGMNSSLKRLSILLLNGFVHCMQHFSAFTQQ